MSVQAMTWVIDNSRHKGGELLLLILLANHAGSDEWSCWPSTRLLAQESRLTRRQVQRILRALEMSGEIRSAMGAGPHGTTLYYVSDQQHLGATSASGRNNVAGDMDVAKGRHGRHPNRKEPEPTTKGPLRDLATLTPQQRMFGEVCLAMGYPTDLAPSDAREVGGIAKALIEKGLQPDESAAYLAWLTGPESPIVNGTRVTLHSLPKWIKDWRAAPVIVTKPNRPRRNVDNILALADRMEAG